MQNPNPKITVLMPVYNSESFLKEAIDSILDQTFTDFEFIIINDGSTDTTKNIINSYNDIRMKIVNNKKNIGLTKSLNKGLKLSKGEYIARMDADDISLKNRLKIESGFLNSNPEYGLIAARYSIIDKNGNILKNSGSYLNPEEIYYTLNFQNCLTHSSVIFRKGMVLKIGGYNEALTQTQDYELWYRLSKVTKIYQTREILIKWRMSNKNISHFFKDIQKETEINEVKKNLESCIESKLKKKEIKLLQLKEITIFSDLKRVLYLLNKINKKLLLKEFIYIKKIGLSIRKIKKAMELKKRNLLFYYFRNTPLKKSLKHFLSLNIRFKYILLKAFFIAFTKKIHNKIKA